MMNLIEGKARAYDAALVAAGTAQSYDLLKNMQDSLAQKLIEDPIISCVGLMTMILIFVRVLRVLQKMRREAKEK